MKNDNKTKESKDLVTKTKMKLWKKIVITILIFILLAIIAFVTYEKATVNNTYYIGEKNLQIPVFVYHDIVGDESQIQYDYMQTTYDTFKKQITGLMKLGYKPISYQDLEDYKNGKKAIPKWSFVITFDDGYTGVYTYAYQFAKEQNIPMTSFINNNTIGTEDVFYNWNQAKEMEESGLISIYSHGLTHARYNEETPQKLLEDTNKSYEELDEKLGNNRLKVFTYPYGLHTQEERVALWNNGYIQNLTDNRINLSNDLDLSGIHRSYPLNDSVFKMLVKIQYRVFRYEILRKFLNYKINFNVHLLFF